VRKPQRSLSTRVLDLAALQTLKKYPALSQSQSLEKKTTRHQPSNMPIAVALSPRAITALGAMALITLCFQTFDSLATPSQSDAMTLARLNIVDQQMATLRATMNHVLKETNTTIPSNLK
jgi:hypothetical protein